MHCLVFYGEIQARSMAVAISMEAVSFRVNFNFIFIIEYELPITLFG